MTVLVLASCAWPIARSCGRAALCRGAGAVAARRLQVAYFVLYALMIALPVVGYVASTAGGHEVPWFGVFVFPALAPQDKALAHLAIQAHFWLGWTIIAISRCTVAAVAWHLWVKRDEVFARMWPSRAAPAREGGARATGSPPRLTPIRAPGFAGPGLFQAPAVFVLK